MFWLIVFLMFLGAGTLENPTAGLLGLGVIGCLFYKLCDFVTRCNDAAHSAIQSHHQRVYEEDLIRKAQIEQINANRTKSD